MNSEEFMEFVFSKSELSVQRLGNLRLWPLQSGQFKGNDIHSWIWSPMNGKTHQGIDFPTYEVCFFKWENYKIAFIKICPNFNSNFFGVNLVTWKKPFTEINRICQKKGILFITIYQTKDNEVWQQTVHRPAPPLCPYFKDKKNIFYKKI